MGSKVSSVKTQGVFNKRSCRECKDRMNLNNFPIISYDCLHRAKTCLVCLLNHIVNHIDDEQISGEMPCPHPKCKQSLSRIRMFHMPYPTDIIQQYKSAITSTPSPSS